MPDIEVSTTQQQDSTPGGAQDSARERKEERRRERRARRERRLRARQAELSNQLDAFMYEGGGTDMCVPPPPYATLPPQQQPPGGPAAAAPPQRGGWRSSIPSFARRRGCDGGDPVLYEDDSKSCCGVLVSQSVSIRWFVVMIAFVGICCAVVGTVLGAMKASGREHLTVSLLMIGVGVVLITVSGIAWRLTSRDAPSCRAMMGLDPHAECGDGRFLARPPYGRNGHHPYAGMLYSEFQYRPPPPSYQASMQEYRLRLLLMDRNAPPPPAPLPAVVSPPPAYRGPPRIGLPVSRPPSYRSRTSDHPAPVHSRHTSQLSYLSAPIPEGVDTAKDLDLEHASVVPVVPHSSNLHKASIIIHSDDGEKDNYISNIRDQFTRVQLKDKEEKVSSPRRPDGVTIVQNSEMSGGGGEGVVVTVSASVDREASTSARSTPEVDILAHL